jgi:hypothetical protein
MLVFSGCQRVNYFPGASYGYYIWEEDGKIHIFWSIDRKDASFSGSVKTDGKIKDIELVSWEEADNWGSDDTSVTYNSALSTDDYTDGIVVEILEYDFIEFDLRIDDGYDLSRVHVGGFLNNPESSPFKIGPGYFDEVRNIPWYERHPFSGFFYKMFSNRYFTFLFIFIIGVVIIEILRITTFSPKKRSKLYIVISYAILACLIVLIYFILRYLVL